MKKSNIASFVAGAVLFGTAGALAGQYIAYQNSFPVKLNGENISMEGYNIDGSTYFKLRDIADAVGGFSVDFHNDTIELAKDGYVYDTTSAKTENQGEAELTYDEAVAIAEAYYRQMEKEQDPDNECDDYDSFIVEECGTGKYYRVLAMYGKNFMADYSAFFVSKADRAVVEMNGDVVRDVIIGEWQCYDDMEEHSVTVRFEPDGKFYCETWRVKGQGTYTVTDKGDIEVKYDVYFQGAGSSEYEFYYSTNETYQMSRDELIRNDGKIFGQPKG
ncbi:MAG: hypothetical protein PUF72_05745 [Clostridiales bacterium]|nr:hypothetical protein [Clostridiales bacterium]